MSLRCGQRIISFVAHPCPLLAIRPGESIEASGALQDKLNQMRERIKGVTDGGYKTRDVYPSLCVQSQCDKD